MASENKKRKGKNAFIAHGEHKALYGQGIKRLSFFTKKHRAESKDLIRKEMIDNEH